jgi:hypothetical protein
VDGADREVEDLVERLEAVSEELAERALVALRAAVQDGATARPDVEKRLTRARRSVDKAVAVLRERQA